MANTIKKFEGLSLISAEFGTQLAIIDGMNFWSVSDSIPAEDVTFLESMNMVNATASEIVKVKANSNRVTEINNSVKEAIRDLVSIDDELSALRTGDTAVTDAIAAFVAAGQAQKTDLGF